LGRVVARGGWCGEVLTAEEGSRRRLRWSTRRCDGLTCGRRRAQGRQVANGTSARHSWHGGSPWRRSMQLEEQSGSKGVEVSGKAEAKRAERGAGGEEVGLCFGARAHGAAHVADRDGAQAASAWPSSWRTRMRPATGRPVKRCLTLTNGPCPLFVFLRFSNTQTLKFEMVTLLLSKSLQNFKVDFLKHKEQLFHLD
jgi:hypothetical protein